MSSRFEQFTAAIASIHKCILKIERMELSKYGLKAPHTQCLLVMHRHPDGITAARLCEICEKDKAAISRTIAELEQAGMVQREDPNGKRYRSCLKLSEQGMQVAASVQELAHNAVGAATGGYGEEQREVFTSTLALIASNLETICREGLNATK